MAKTVWDAFGRRIGSVQTMPDGKQHVYDKNNQPLGNVSNIGTVDEPKATKQAKKPTTKSKVQKPKPTGKKPAKVTVITPEAGKPVQPTEA